MKKIVGEELLDSSFNYSSIWLIDWEQGFLDKDEGVEKKKTMMKRKSLKIRASFFYGK